MSLLDWLLTKILIFYYNIAYLFGKYLGSFFSHVFIFIAQHANYFLAAFIIFFCSLLRIHHSKIGLFFGCKDYTSKNYFEQPCKVIFHFPNVNSMQVKRTDKIDSKKK